MAVIASVELIEFEYTAIGITMDANGFDIVCSPGDQLNLRKYAIAITDVDGVRGEYVMMWGGTPMAFAQTRFLAQHLVGRDANQREYLFDEFKRAIRQYDHMGYGAIDIALWDLLGKRSNQSISTLLGGYKTRLPTYASTFHGDRNGILASAQDYIDFARHCYALGYRAFKAHGWSAGDAKEEADLVRRLGSSVGADMDLMLDPASHLRTYTDALTVGRACDDAEFRWYEDPFRDTGVSINAHKMLRDALKTPILATEHVRGIEPKADFAVQGGTDLLRADPEYDLGITGTMKIAHFAEAMGMDVELHAVGPAHRHCLSAIRNSTYYELALVGPDTPNPMPPIYSCGYSDSLESVDKDGCVPVPNGPGLGVTYDWDFIRAHATVSETF